jgi:hypothetical protein
MTSTTTSLAEPASSLAPASTNAEAVPWAANLSWSLVQRDWFLVAVVTLVLIVLYTTCEHFQANNGLGNDGYLYAILARDFPKIVFQDRLDSYYVQRISIPALLHYSSRLLHLELTDKTILRIWRGLDLLCLAWMAWLWCGIVRELGLRLKGKWLGVLFFFGNFAILKWSAFYPNITDVPAYAMGLTMLYSYLRGRSVALGLVTFVGAFTWPTAVYFGLVLLLFPREREPAPQRRGAPWYLHALLAGAAATVVYLRLQFFHHRGGFYIGNETRASDTFLNLGIAISALYILFSLFFLLDCGNLFQIRSYLRLPARRSFWVAVIVFAAVRGLMDWLDPLPTALTPTLIFNHILWSSVLSPGLFLVTLVMFYGPVMVLAALLWKRVCANLHHYGTGLVLVVAMAIPIGLCCESRRVINLIPFVIPFVV